MFSLSLSRVTKPCIHFACYRDMLSHGRFTNQSLFHKCILIFFLKGMLNFKHLIFVREKISWYTSAKTTKILSDYSTVSEHDTVIVKTFIEILQTQILWSAFWRLKRYSNS